MILTSNRTSQQGCLAAPKMPQRCQAPPSSYMSLEDPRMVVAMQVSWKRRDECLGMCCTWIGGGSKCLYIFTPTPGKMIQFDWHVFLDGVETINYRSCVPDSLEDILHIFFQQDILRGFRPKFKGILYWIVFWPGFMSRSFQRWGLVRWGALSLYPGSSTRHHFL